MKAIMSPIPLSIFDDLLQAVLETLYMNYFPAFASRQFGNQEKNLQQRSLEKPLKLTINTTKVVEHIRQQPTISSASSDDTVLDTDNYVHSDYNSDYLDMAEDKPLPAPLSLSALEKNRLNAKIANQIQPRVCSPSPITNKSFFDEEHRSSVSSSNSSNDSSNADTLYYSSFGVHLECPKSLENDQDFFNVEDYYYPTAATAPVKSEHQFTFKNVATHQAGHNRKKLWSSAKKQLQKLMNLSK